MIQNHAELAAALYDHGCIKFGTFKLKSGLHSPIYIDLRLLVSHPPLLRLVGQTLARAARDLAYDRIAAIPYAGLPIGVAMALELDRPMIYPRREMKAYGTRRAVEGAFNPGDRVLLIDDLITRGGSKLEAIEALEGADLIIQDVLVLIDREQGGAQDLADQGYALHAVLRLTELLQTLQAIGRITAEQRDEVLDYLERTSAV